jgi:hypothetical protein
MEDRVKRYLMDIIAYCMPLATIGSGAALLYRVVMAGGIK